MGTPKKVGVKVPTRNEILKKYGNMIVTASESKEFPLKLPSTFYFLNDTIG